MTTVINNPGNGDSDSAGVGMIVGIIIVIILAGIFLVYILPTLRASEVPADNSIDVNVKLPVDDTTKTQP